MRTIYYIAFFLTAILLNGLNVQAQAKLEVTVTNIKEAKGTIRVGLFDSEEKFLKNAVDGKIVKANHDQVTVVFENLKPGNYAASVIHDENENGDLDKNMIGIPSEGFGFGNDAMGTFGPPSFDESKITIVDKQTVKQSIKLRYF
jgi:uncharacterized protein (DUF2141 family)